MSLSLLEDAFRLVLASWDGARPEIESLCVSTPNDADPSVAWAVARLAFVLGPPGARDEADPEAIAQAVRRIEAIVEAKRRTFVRVGDPTWTRYAVVGYWPVGAPDQEDRALLLPKGETYRIEYNGATGRPTIRKSVNVFGMSGEAIVPWPSWTPPLVEHLAAGREGYPDACGFLPLEWAVAGNATLPPGVDLKVSG